MEPEKYQRLTLITYDEEGQPECVFDFGKAKLIKEANYSDYQLIIETNLCEDGSLWFALLPKLKNVELRKKLKKFLKLWDAEIEGAQRV